MSKAFLKSNNSNNPGMLLVSVWSIMPASNLSYIFANESTLKKANDPLIIS